MKIRINAGQPRPRTETMGTSVGGKGDGSQATMAGHLKRFRTYKRTRGTPFTAHPRVGRSPRVRGVEELTAAFPLPSQCPL